MNCTIFILKVGLNVGLKEYCQFVKEILGKHTYGETIKQQVSVMKKCLNVGNMIEKININGIL